jgi:hypothetical protein
MANTSAKPEHIAFLEILETITAITAVIRESLKTTVIVVYLAFASWTLITLGDPYCFLPLLPWALWSRTELSSRRRYRDRRP